MDETVLNDEMKIAAERLSDHRKFLDELMLGKTVSNIKHRKPPVCVGVGETVATAVEKMKNYKIGCVLICENKKLVGILTERDLLKRILGTNKDIEKVKVEEIMTADPEYLSPNDSLVFALNKMGVGGFRHLPLVDENRIPVGQLSIRHIVWYIVDFYSQIIMNIPPEPGKNIANSREGA